MGFDDSEAGGGFSEAPLSDSLGGPLSDSFVGFSGDALMTPEK